MKTRIATTFGLALILLLGVLGAMTALGQMNVGSIFALDVSTVVVEAEPNDPGTVAKWTVQFTNNTTLDGGADSIIIEFEDDVKFPPVLSPADITIQTTRISNVPAASTTTGSIVANPLGVNIRFVAQYSGTAEGTGNKDEPEITLEIGDMEPSTGTTGFQGITGITPVSVTEGGATSTVTITFRQTAGVKNPTESKENKTCNSDNNCGTGSFQGAAHRLTGYDVQVATNKALSRVQAVTTEGADRTALIPRKLVMSDRDGVRGKTITVTGKGFRNSTTATVWLDKDGGGTRDADEIDLASAVVGSDDTFVATVTITNPPFKAGESDGSVTNNSCTAQPKIACNSMNAIDGRSNRLIGDLTFTNTLSNSTYTESLPIYKLESSWTVTPTTAAIGDTVQVTVKDFTSTTTTLSDTTITITLGGVKVIAPSGTVTGGESTFNIDIPNSVPVGAQALKIRGTVFGTGVFQSSMTITGAVLTLTPEVVVPNQSVTVIGRGFSNSETINTASDQSSISISGSTSDLKGAGAAKTDKFNANASVTTDNGGNWSANLIMPINITTTTPGTHTLKIKDNGGREGVIDIVVEARTLILDPVESRVGSIITITGTGFPADNTATGAESTPSVSIIYTVGSTNKTVATLSPDAAGNVSGSFKVPLDAGIPSTNSVRAEFTCPTGADCTTVTTGATHEVPRAVLNIDPTTGPPGTVVTVSGIGFKGFSTVTQLDIGSIDVRPAPVPATGELGNFGTAAKAVTFIVPELNTGAQSVVATVSSTTASTSFTVTAAAIVPTPVPLVGPAAPAEAFAVLISNNDNLLRVWNFDAATQNVGPDFGWTLYDPRPVFAAANSVTEIVSGRFYWINVRESQTATLGAVLRSLFAGWNPVTW